MAWSLHCGNKSKSWKVSMRLILRGRVTYDLLWFHAALHRWNEHVHQQKNTTDIPKTQTTTPIRRVITHKKESTLYCSETSRFHVRKWKHPWWVNADFVIFFFLSVKGRVWYTSSMLATPWTWPTWITWPRPTRNWRTWSCVEAPSLWPTLTTATYSRVAFFSTTCTRSNPATSHSRGTSKVSLVN